MSDEVIRVLETISMLFLVILAGLVIRRRGLLDEAATRKLSRFVADIAFPALVFTSLLRTVDAESLAGSWHLPLLGIAIILVGSAAGLLLGGLLGGEGASRRSFAFAAGYPNWLFIPLPIAMALYGEHGERAVLLVNVGVLLVFWSVGVWTVRGGGGDATMLRSIALNPGLLSTIAGIAVALALPAARGLQQLDVTQAPPATAALSVAVQAVAFIGDTTVPLSMIVTGALLAGSSAGRLWDRRVIAISALRLAAVPALAMLLFWLADAVGLRADPATRMTMVIIAAMPVAVTCSVVAERYGGDVPLVARAIFVSTIASVATVPLTVWVMSVIGLS